MTNLPVQNLLDIIHSLDNNSPEAGSEDKEEHRLIEEHEKTNPAMYTIVGQYDDTQETVSETSGTYTVLKPCQFQCSYFNTHVLSTISRPSTEDNNDIVAPSNEPGTSNTMSAIDMVNFDKYSDESYISGSDESVQIMNRFFQHQFQAKEPRIQTETVAICSPNEMTDIVNEREDSDETYIPDSDESFQHRIRAHRNPRLIEESSTECEDDASEQQEKRSTRKRLRHPATWKCNKRKKDTLSGKKHTSKSGKTISAKSMKGACRCKKKCYEKITEQKRKDVFELFWDANKTWEHKRQFILTCVKEKLTERQRIRSDDGVAKKKRSKTRLYFFSIDNESIEVCQKFFLSTLGVSVTFVTNALKLSNYGMTLEDKRGKKEPPNKIKDDLKNKIRNHIEKFPKYESHYSREKTKREYLGGHLTIEKLYGLYVDECKENSEEPGKIWLYRHIFNTEYNIGFKPPQTDTCDDCDRYEVQIKELEGDDLEAIKLERQKHLDEAGTRYTLKAADKQNSLLNRSEQKMVTVDLQKCLPTPLLTNGQTFYFRKLWTFNYTILDSTTNECTCIMWDESKSGRGGNELASGLLKWFMENVAENSDVKTVVIWSDNCAGQNKNMHLISFYLWLLKNIPHLETIDHKYLLKGHTHMEVDGVHSLIERYKNRQRQFSVATPWDWQQVVRACSSTRLPIKVINMEVEDFKHFGELHDGRSSPFIHRKKGTNGQNVQYMETVWIRVDKKEYGTLQYKTTFDEAAFQKVSLIRNQRREVNDIPIPNPIRTDLNPISTKKFQDLQKTMTWVPRIFHSFYNNLPHADGQREDI